MENYEVNFEEMEELEDTELPAGCGFGCICSWDAHRYEKQ